jgi:hypothetical protein
MSTRWLELWKELEYDNPVIDENLGEINEDLLLAEKFLLTYPEKSNESYCNSFTKREIQEGKDYILLSKSLWKQFSKKYEGQEIIRKAYRTDQSFKKVEVVLR